MSTAANKSLIQRFNDEVWNRGNLTAIEELFAPDWVWHSAPPGVPAKREGLRGMIASFGAAFSGVRASVDEQIAEGDTVAWRWTFQGDHTGPFMGIPPTGRRIVLTGVSIDRIAGGKFVERRDSADMLGLMQQLGAVPAQ